MKQKVIIAGAGPGAADLISVRAVNALKHADVVIYAGSLVNPEILQYCAEKTIFYNSARLSLSEVIELIKVSVNKNLRVVRLHTGDPSIYGAIAEQMNELDKLNIDYEIIPGISSVLASAAALNAELTMPGITQTVIMTRQEGRTPVPELERLKHIGKGDATVALFLSVGLIDKLVAQLLEAGRCLETPVGVVYRASWGDQKIVRGNLGNIVEKISAAKIGRQAMIIVGNVLNRGGKKSLLYDEGFSHGYRNNVDCFSGATAIYALTAKGVMKAKEIAGGLEYSQLFVPEKYRCNEGNINLFSKRDFETVLKDNWQRFNAHIFIMATGIVVRKITSLLENKTTDPAVIVTDEYGRNIISLLSGHLGRANNLSRIVAGITGGNAVVTTASDNMNITAFDELAELNNWRVVNPELIKILNSKLVDGEKIDVVIPDVIFEKFYSKVKNLRLIKNTSEIKSDVAVVCCETGAKTAGNILQLVPKKFFIGIGCRRNTSCAVIKTAVEEALIKLKVENKKQIAAIASFDLKKDEKGLLEFIDEFSDVNSFFFSADELNSVKHRCPNISEKALSEFGVYSVAEAAALKAGGEKLVLPKTVFNGVTVAIAEDK